MGLPMWVEPTEDKPQPVHKTDPTAPARSAIRRQRTVRQRPQSRRSVGSRDPVLRAMMSEDHRQSIATRAQMLEDIRRRDVGGIYPSPAALDEAGYSSNPLSRLADTAHSEASHRSRTENGRAILRDALSYETPHERMRMTRNAAVPPAPESVRLVQTHPVADPTPIPAPPSFRHMPGYPMVQDLGIAPGPRPARRSGSAGSQTSRSRSSHFAPAYRFGQNAQDRYFTLINPGRRRTAMEDMVRRMEDLREGLDREPLDESRRDLFETTLSEIRGMMNNPLTEEDPVELLWEEDAYLADTHAYVTDLEDQVYSRPLTTLRSLRDEAAAAAARSQSQSQSQHQQPSQQRQRQRRRDVDGLGDRDRSFSPDEFAWDSMLTTIPYDSRIPSAPSSFTSSATASMSMSNSHSNSSHSSITPPSQSQVPHNPTTTSTDPEACPAPPSPRIPSSVLHPVIDDDSDYPPLSPSSNEYEPEYLARRASMDALLRDAATARRNLDFLASDLERDLSRHRVDAHTQVAADRTTAANELERHRVDSDVEAQTAANSDFSTGERPMEFEEGEGSRERFVGYPNGVRGTLPGMRTRTAETGTGTVGDFQRQLREARAVREQMREMEGRMRRRMMVGRDGDGAAGSAAAVGGEGARDRGSTGRPLSIRW